MRRRPPRGVKSASGRKRRALRWEQTMSMADRDGFIWYDGKLVPWRDATTHVLTHSLHYGLSVFEGVRAYDGELGTAIFRLQDHTRRLFNSAHIYQIPMPFDRTRSTRRSARSCARTSSSPATCAPGLLRPREDGRVAQGCPRARGHRRLALGRLPGRGSAVPGHPRQGFLLCPPARQRDDAARQGRDHLRQLDPGQYRGPAGRLRRSPAAGHRRLRGRGLGRNLFLVRTGCSASRKSPRP